MEEKKIGYKDVLKIANVRKLILSNVINRLGDSIDAIAFTWLVYQITGSATWSALMFGLNQLPGIFVQPLAGPFVEGKNKKHIVIFTDILRGLIITAFVLMYLKNMVNPWTMAAFTLLITTVESFHLPASSAFVPELIPEEYYVSASGLNMTVSKVFELIGMAIGGVIIAKFGVGAAMLIDAASFFIGASINGMIQYEGCKLKDATIAQQSYKTKFIEGIRYLLKNGTVLYFCLLCVIMNFLMAPLNSLLAPLTSEVYGMNSEFLSFLTIMMSASSILASLVMPKVVDKVSFDVLMVTLGVVMGLGCFCLSLGRLVYGSEIGAYLLGGICFFVMGFSSGLLSGCLSVTFVKSVDRDYLARVISVFNAIAVAAMPVATFIVSLITVKLSVGTIIGGTGICAAVLFSCIYFLQYFKLRKGTIKNEASFT